MSTATPAPVTTNRIDKLEPGQQVTLRFHGPYAANDETVTFLGIEGTGDDRRARFFTRGTPLTKSDPDDGYEWEAYRYNGTWAYGSSADRLSIVRPTPAQREAEARAAALRSDAALVVADLERALADNNWHRGDFLARRLRTLAASIERYTDA